MNNPKHTRLLLASMAALGVTGLWTSNAYAVDYSPVNLAGGTQSWTDSATWSPTGTPTTSADTANLGVALTDNLTLDIGATDQTVGNITMGGTAGAVTTNISSTGGSLILSNSTSLPTANATIISGGVAGSVNQISANVLLGETLDISASSTNSLTLAGNLGQSGGARTIANLMTGGATLTIGTGASSQIQLHDSAVPATARNLVINNTNSSGGTVANSTIINGVFVGSGTLTFGSGGQNAAAVYTLKQEQTITSTVTLNRQVYVLEADNAFGTGQLVTSNNNNQNAGGELQSNNDARTLGNTLFRLANPIAVTGTNSLTISGSFYQSSNRVLGNILPEGKSLTLSGLTATDGAAATPLMNNNRALTVEGTGTTKINGQLVNALDISGSVGTVGTNDLTAVGSLIKRGSGRLELNNATNTLRGTITSEGGLIVFGAATAHGNATSILAKAAGGVSYALGTADAGFAAFAGKLAPLSAGSLALPAGDSAANLDFTTTLASAPNISVVGDGDMTYTGTVTPGTGGYNWGGTSGKLTLGANAGTGANNVTYTNGGTVVMAGSADYTGTTSVNGVVMATAQSRYTAKSGGTTSLVNTNLPSTLEVASVSDAGVASSLGASSNAAANLVLNMGTLRHTGAAASSSDRLFTVGTGGATIESTGTGTLTLGSAGGANVTAGTGARTLTLGGTNTGLNTLGSDLANGALVTDTLAVTKTGTGTWVLSGTNTYTGATAINAGTLLVNGSITGAGAVSVAAGATLGGSGLITGATTVTGTLSPGNSAGLLSFGGNLTLAGASTSQFEINGTSLGVSYDSITAVGAITYGGTLNLVFGAAVTPGTYDLVNAASQSGDFSSVTFTGAFADSMIGSAVITPGTGWAWASALNTYAFDNASGNLVVTSAIPEPASFGLLAGMAVLGGCLTRRRRVQG
jgi:fibronectin-binding autotransporter adhesin